MFFAARYNQKRSDGPVHFHYVAPSFWAWKGGETRLKGLAKFVDHVFCILPYEEAGCQSNGLAATFVGHPILEDVLELNMVSLHLPLCDVYWYHFLLKCYFCGIVQIPKTLLRVQASTPIIFPSPNSSL